MRFNEFARITVFPHVHSLSLQNILQMNHLNLCKEHAISGMGNQRNYFHIWIHYICTIFFKRVIYILSRCMEIRNWAFKIRCCLSWQLFGQTKSLIGKHVLSKCIWFKIKSEEFKWIWIKMEKLWGITLMKM